MTDQGDRRTEGEAPFHDPHRCGNVANHRPVELDDRVVRLNALAVGEHATTGVDVVRS